MRTMRDEIEDLFPLLGEGQEFTTLVDLHRKAMDLVGGAINERFLIANVSLALQNLGLFHPLKSIKWPDYDAIFAFLTEYIENRGGSVNSNLIEVAAELATDLEDIDIHYVIKPKCLTVSELAALAVVIVEMENGESKP